MAPPFLQQVQPQFPGNADFSKQLSLLGDTIGQAVQSHRRQSLLSDVLNSPNPDFNVAATRLLQAGDVQGAVTMAQLGQQQFSRGIQTQQLANQSRGLDIQERGLTEKPSYQKITGPNGEERLVLIPPLGSGTPRDVTPGALGGQPNNPFSMGKMTESQSKDGLYTSRMINAEKILSDPKVTESGTSLVQQGLGKIPVAGNYMVSDSFQKLDQAQRDFLNSVLRRESGAVISKEEFNNGKQQYFPQPGDSAEKLAQKRANRLEAIKGIGSGAGPSYKPPDSIKAIPELAPKAQAGDPLSAARDAIQRGAPREAVIQRLMQNGINPAGL